MNLADAAEALVRLLMLFFIQTSTEAYPGDIDSVLKGIFRFPMENSSHDNMLLTPTEEYYPSKSTRLPTLQRPNRTPVIANDNCLNDVDSGPTYCTQVDDYPDITSFKRELKTEYRSFFHEDMLMPKNIAPRFGGEFAEEVLCGSSERLVYPKMAQGADSKWHYIVNDDELRQGVRVEECRNEGKDCQFMQNLPNSRKSACKQNYTFRLMLAVAKNGTVITEQHFKFPSCCQCVVSYKNGY